MMTILTPQPPPLPPPLEVPGRRAPVRTEPTRPFESPRRRPPIGRGRLLTAVAVVAGIGLLGFGALQLANGAELRGQIDEAQTQLAGLEDETATLQQDRDEVLAQVQTMTAALQQDRDEVLAELQTVTATLEGDRDEVLAQAGAFAGQAADLETLTAQFDGQLELVLDRAEDEKDAWNAYIDASDSCIESRGFILDAVADCFAVAEVDSHWAAFEAYSQAIDDMKAMLQRMEEALDG
jgi:chromosome segregation ATPase